jgi:hypothetical protein
MPVAAKLPSKQMNNSFLRSAKLDVARRAGEQTHTHSSSPPPVYQHSEQEAQQYISTVVRI